MSIATEKEVKDDGQPAAKTEKLEQVAVRFAGDSGDGMLCSDARAVHAEHALRLDQPDP